MLVLIGATANVGAASAANNPSDSDEFAAEAAPKLKISVFSVTSANERGQFFHRSWAIQWSLF